MTQLPDVPPQIPGPLDPMHREDRAFSAAPNPWPAGLSWSIIVVCVLAMMALVAVEQRSQLPTSDPAEGNLIVEVQSRLLFGASQFTGSQGATQTIAQIEQLRTLSTRPGVAWRLAGVEMAISTNRSIAQDHVLEDLDRVSGDLKDQSDKDMHALVIRAVQDPESLTPLQKTTLADSLGWAGKLLAAGSAREGDPYWDSARSAALRTFFVLFGALGLYGLAGFFGLILLIVGLILFRSNPPTFSFKPIDTTHNPGLYLEASAVYIALLLILPIFGSLAGSITGPGAKGLSFVFALVGLSIASVIGVIWPALRGARWSEVRHDIGLHSGAGIVRETLCGIAGYLATLPILGIGIVITLFAIFVQSVIQQVISGPGPTPPGDTVGHPVFEMLNNPTIGVVLGVLFLASVFAPFFEETMFRGALLSGCSRRPGVVAGIFIMGFIFAAIHPQGWVAIPALMSLGVCFGFIRFWRGSLIPSMVAHGLHNGMLLTLVVLAVS